MTEETSNNAMTPASRARQQALLEFAVSQSSAVFYIAELTGDTPTRFISANIETITGHSPGRLSGRGRLWFPPHSPGRSRRLQAPHRRCWQSEGALTHEYRFATASGEYLWFRDELSVVEGANEFIGCMVDVTPEKNAELSLRSTDDMIRGIIDALPLPVSMTRLSDRRVSCSKIRRCIKLFGDTPETAPQFIGVQRRLSRQSARRTNPSCTSDGAVDNFEMHFKHTGRPRLHRRHVEQDDRLSAVNGRWSRGW